MLGGPWVSPRHWRGPRARTPGTKVGKVFHVSIILTIMWYFILYRVGIIRKYFHLSTTYYNNYGHNIISYYNICRCTPIQPYCFFIFTILGCGHKSNNKYFIVYIKLERSGLKTVNHIIDKKY